MRIFQFLKNDKNIQYSLILHVGIILIFTFGLTFSINHAPIKTAPIIVDLTKVQIAPKTNLPAKAAVKTETANKKQYAKPKTKVTAPKKQEPKKIAPKPAPKKKEAIKTASKPAPKPTPTPKKKESIINDKSNEDLSSLLASVEKMKTAPTPVPAQPSAIDKLTDSISEQGIEGGIGGDYNLALTISEKDAISSKLKSCWNIDAGAKGVLDLQVGIRAYLNQKGEVTDVKIADTSKYNSDPTFRAIADSARRAVYVCDNKKEESPFKILPKYYPDKYKVWQELYLQFNPLDGGVF